MTEYELAVKYYVEYFWTSRVEWLGKDGTVKELDISSGKFDLPSFISTVGNEPQNTPNLSNRILKSASSQALGIVSSIITKRNKLEFKLNLSIQQGQVERSQKLQEKLDAFKLTKPDATIKVANLDSNTVQFIEKSEHTDENFKEFDGFLKITSMSKTLGYIEIPVKFHRQVDKLTKRGYKQKTSWFVSQDEVSSTWEKPKPSKRETGKKLGADQGIKSCLTLSDGQVTGSCPHGHSLESIMWKLTRCQKGSKGFSRAQKHRTNYINWSIKQLNLEDVKEIGYENVVNIRKGQNTSKFMQTWTFTEIRTAIKRICEEEGVLLTEQGSIYRSQRCSSCGYVHKKNRNKKSFVCGHCGTSLDSDLNGALNHELELFDIPFSLLSMKLNMIGFYWLESGLYDLHGEEITVPRQENLRLR